MKQHITPKQAMEITEEQFYSLFDEVVQRKDWANYHHKKMTVGKMLEFLMNHNIVYWKADKGNCSRVGLVTDEFVALQDFRERELCDALWEAVKSVLN